jgi:hypothetical protein
MVAPDRAPLRSTPLRRAAEALDCREDAGLDQPQPRLARDYERYARKAAAFVRLAMIRLMLRRLAPSR